MAMNQLDPVALAQALIRCPSVTPEDHGALGVLEQALTPLGFTCHRLRFEDANSAPVENLYARLGQTRPNFCFAGHTEDRKSTRLNSSHSSISYAVFCLKKKKKKKTPSKTKIHNTT